MRDNQDLKNKVKFKIIMSEIQDEIKEKSNKNSGINIKLYRMVASIALIFVATTGLVFANEIQEFIKNKFKLGKGIETAIENGYIAESDENYIFCNVKAINKDGKELMKDMKIGVKIESYLIDNSNLSIEMKYKYDEYLNDFFNVSSIHTIMLSDLIISDNEKRILYDGGGNNKEKFEEYCIENNLSYTFGDCNENYLNSGLNVFESKENCLENGKSYIYNFYVENDNYPKSKKINLIFSKIILNEEFSTENITLIGDWNITLEIPEKMYNNIAGNYSVIKCDNNNFDIYTAKLTSTGFELGLRINGLENPSYPLELNEEEKRFYESMSVGEVGLRITDEAKTEFYSTSPYKETYENYYTKHFPTSIDAVRLYVPWIKDTEGCYIQNSKGDKFYISESGCANQKNSFNEDNVFEFYNKFDMTQYDATEYISAIIELYGSPVKILLKRMN